MVGRERVPEAGRVVRGDGTWRCGSEVGRSRGIREGSGRVLTVPPLLGAEPSRHMSRFRAELQVTKHMPKAI